MKVVLVKDVPRLGSKGTVVDVSEGYARNYLIKNSLAVEATSENLSKAKNKKDAIERRIKNELEKELKFAKELKEKGIVVKLKANSEGHLFEKLDARKLLTTINSQSGAHFKEKQVLLSEPIKQIGKYEFILTVKDKKFKVNLKIEAS